MTTKAELLDIAAEAEVDVSDHWTKAEILEALEEAGITVTDEGNGDENGDGSNADEADEPEFPAEVDDAARAEALANVRNAEAEFAGNQAARDRETAVMATADSDVLDAQIAQKKAELEQLQSARDSQ